MWNLLSKLDDCAQWHHLYEMIEGELAHSYHHGTFPHRIRVCVTKTGNDPKADLHVPHLYVAV